MEIDLTSRLANPALRLSKSQRLLAEYITEHCDKAVFLTANRLGDAVGVSESTVVRFAVRLGYDGYPELQRAVQELIRNKLTAVQRLEVTSDLLSGADVLHSVMREDIDRINTTLSNIDNAAFEKAVDLAVSARRIYIVGLRSSSALAEFLYFYFNLIFENVKLISGSSTNAVEQLLHATKDDLVMCISFPRYSRTTVDAVEYAKSKGASVVAITDSPMSPISGHADCALFAMSDTASFVDSLVAPMSLINALVVAVGMHRRKELMRVFEDLEKIWDRYSVYRALDETE